MRGGAAGLLTALAIAARTVRRQSPGPPPIWGFWWD